MVLQIVHTVMAANEVTHRRTNSRAAFSRG
jgi:hypothetical protein